MNKILLLIDTTHDPFPILPAVVALVKTEPAFLQVIFLRRSYLQTDLVYPLGTDLPALQAREESEEHYLRRHARLIHETFTAAGLHWQFYEEAPSLDSILRNSAFSDLILIDGRILADSAPPSERTGELQEKSETIADTLKAPLEISIKDLLTDAHCPVILLRQQTTPVENLVLAYDGNFSSIYAIKQFSYLFPELCRLPAYLLTIPANENKEMENKIYLKNWLPLHFENATVEVLPGKPSEILPAFIQSHPGNTLVVMGAYGRTAISRLFRQSLADSVLQKTDAALFATHE